MLLSTFPDTITAARIARTQVEADDVACVNIVPGLRSIYRWNDAVQDEPEALMILKTVPQVVSLPVVDGHDADLRWVSTSTRTPQA